MQSNNADVIVAGHICLDVIPMIDTYKGSGETLLSPGQLVSVGPATVSPGGVVSNAGLALHRLGVPTRLMGKVGDDLFGRAILDRLRGYAPVLADSMIVAKGEHSSYSIVISPPGVDRIFLHCSGANDTFGADDVAYDQLGGARVLHFGYPPLMRRLYANKGDELATLMRRVKEKDLTTSLDMAQVDPNSDAARVDWPALLERVLPYVDLFQPSLGEILFMLDRDRFERMSKDGGVLPRLDGSLLSELSERLAQWGAAVVVFKLGDQGLYVRTTGDAGRLADMGVLRQKELWRNRELLAPCFRTRVVGTTGSGDCTIAGFLVALLYDLAPEEVITAAVAVGACSVEAADATSGVPNWSVVQQRIHSVWPRSSVALSLPQWRWSAEKGLWIGPNNQN